MSAARIFDANQSCGFAKCHLCVLQIAVNDIFVTFAEILNPKTLFGIEEY